MKKIITDQAKKATPVQTKKSAVLLVGKRCGIVREELKIKRRIIAEVCGVTYQQILNFETKGESSLATLIYYINYLHEIGKINPAWIFLQDNTHISKVTRTYNDISEQVQNLLNMSIDRVDLPTKSNGRRKK